MAAVDHHDKKNRGQYFTPDAVAASLVSWAVHAKSDRMLDPSCGDGRFLALHRSSVGVEQDPRAYALANERAPWALIHEGDFFAWAAETKERFECAAGNPPFIRYQLFSGGTRDRALKLCLKLGVEFRALTSSWAPFLVATASLLKPGGRLAFVVPAEIGHAPYAEPLLSYLVGSFAKVQVVAVREKLFPDLSEDAWLLYAEGYGSKTDHLSFSTVDRFNFLDSPPPHAALIGLSEWQAWGSRLRPFLLPAAIRAVYRNHVDVPSAVRLGDVARVGIGYVTGNNDFFHLRPSDANKWGIAKSFLYPTVRNGRSLTHAVITKAVVNEWLRRDEQVLLLRLDKAQKLDSAVKRYLRSTDGQAARKSYKCRNRDPWYVVPDVIVPDAFLSYMSGNTPLLVANSAACVCTNSVHAIRLNGTMTVRKLQAAWRNTITELSCEIEGHPLGGGMLKIEPREASRVLLGHGIRAPNDVKNLVSEGLKIMRTWRHNAQ